MALFVIANIYYMKNEIYNPYQDDPTEKHESWPDDCCAVAGFFFWVLHWLYVSEYTRVAVMAPLTFCDQDLKT